MKKKVFVSLLALVMVFACVSTAAFAQGAQQAPQQVNGQLMITEPGRYVLNGKMTGSVVVNPGKGDVELVLDGADIDGRNGPGIVALSGDSLTINTPAGSINRVIDGAQNPYQAAIYSVINIVFVGNGSTYITGNSQNAIQAPNASMSFYGGNYAVKAPNNDFSAKNVTVNGGNFSVQGKNTFDPKANLNIYGGQIDEVPMPQQQEHAGFFSNLASSVGGFLGSVIPKTGNDQEIFADKFAQQLPEQSSNSQQSNQAPGNQQGSFPGNGNQQPQNGFADGNGSQQASQDDFPNGSDNQAPQMPGNANGQNQQGMQPGMDQGMQQGNWETADSASEMVMGTMTNSAASLEADYDNATYITVTDDDSQVKITSSGTYVVTGSSSDGNITVKKGTTGVVLVLDDLDLTSSTGATVSVNKEAEVKIIISGNVTLTDNENPEDENSEDADVADAFDGASLKAKANSQVYVTGDGTLTINGNAKNGIKGGDDSSIIFDGVTVNINAVNDGINSNYDVTLLSGDFTINAGDDAIHADHILTIGNEDGTGPDVDIVNSEEGLEGTVVNILGGDITISSNDDAINAANADGAYEGELDYAVNMTGGNVTINSKGDGIDSNGDVNLVGGSAEIHSSSAGGEAGIDYDGQLYISEDFSLNNQNGVAGPDGMPGQMPGGQDFGGQNNGGYSTPSAPSFGGDMGGGQMQPSMGGMGGGPSDGMGPQGGPSNGGPGMMR